MPKSTHIVERRFRRKKRSGHGVRYSFQVLLVLLLGSAFLTFFLSAGSVTAAAAVYDYFTRDLPNFTEIEALGRDADGTLETTKIYAQGPDRDGDGSKDPVLIYEVVDPLDGDRRWLSLDEIPQSVIDATVSLEDRTFWANQGFDAQGMARAFYQYVLLGGEVQDGSSITQHLVKNNLIAEERRAGGAEPGFDTYGRGIEELLLAHKISQTYTKEQIVEWYLNTSFYGNLAYGIEAAARVYFDKAAAQLTLPEAAMLASIPQSPALNPVDNFERAKARQELVLDQMFRENEITRDQLVTARYTPLAVSSGIEERFDIIAPHFALYVREQLEERFGPEMVLRGGLQVYTSLNLEMQQQAECVARAHVSRLSGTIGDNLAADERADCPALDYLPALSDADVGLDHNVNNGSVLALDPRTGEIKVMVGSLDYWNEAIDGSFNVAVDGLRQPGTAFKPFTYLTALSQGYTAATMVMDVETDFGTPYDGVAYVPQNDDGRFHGPMRLRQAFANSYNVPAVEVMSWVGVNNVIQTAHNLGITTLDGNNYGLSLTLGGGEVRLIDMVYAFSVLDNRGVMVGRSLPEEEQRLGHRSLDPVAIVRVENSDGNVLYEYDQPQQQEIVTPQLAFLMNDVMSDRTARCPAFGCPNPLELPDNRPAAAKTGTTNDFRDAWTVGYTPQLATGVWVGNSDNSPMENVPGVKGAAPIWHAFMSWALQDEPAETWTRPPGIVENAVCDISGQLPTPHCPTVTEFFIEGTEPTTVDNIHQAFQINRQTGRLATIYTPPELVETEVYRVFPDRAADWVRENDIEQPPTEYDTITGTPGREGSLTIDSPEPFAFVNGQVEIEGRIGGDDFTRYRLAYFQGLAPDNVQVITDEVTPENGQALGNWNVGDLNGLYTLILTAFREDGTFEEVSVPVTVDNAPPEAQLLSPVPNQAIFTDEEWVTIQAAVADDVSVDRVEFYLDGAVEPFAAKTVSPFTERWMIRGPGCHQFRVVAIDAAGNESSSDTVRACFVARESD